MQAACWMGRQDVEVTDVPDPTILNSRDAILRVTSAAICGSDLHLYNGFIPTMKRGDILGHEFMGEVVDTGPAVKNLKVGDRVVVPFCIACGMCWSCEQGMTSLCENSNPSGTAQERAWGHSGSGAFGYSHLTGGFPGAQAEFVRVPFADFGALKVNGLPDEKVLFLGDILPTGYQAAEQCDILPGQVVAVWGCGPVGQFAIRCAFMLGAERVIAIDRYEYRLKLARAAGADTINYEEVEGHLEMLKEMTGGRGPDACIDAVGMEAHSEGLQYAYDRVKQAVRLESDRPIALREAVMACRNGGVVSVPGVYGGLIDKFPMGVVMNRGLTIRSGQTHVHRYMRPLLDRIQNDEIDPSEIITHRMPLADAAKGYKMFMDRDDECEKVVLTT
jgi:threonine dehydrogenase-like Zn-dependent dehydrogenase